MKIIFGLGNPGGKFAKTRHNAGFLALDKIREKFDFPQFQFEKKFNAEVSQKTIGDEKIILVKPWTFMNLSGESVRAVLDFWKASEEDILVIHDDIDIELGKVKSAVDSSSAGHNGVQNIFDILGTQKISRKRIGISKTPEEKEACHIETHNYVLGKFSEEELEKLKEAEEKILEEMEVFFE
jgi:peptidyl-tRNA hydrolase, PTH1 family